HSRFDRRVAGRKSNAEHSLRRADAPCRHSFRHCARHDRGVIGCLPHPGASSDQSRSDRSPTRRMKSNIRHLTSYERSSLRAASTLEISRGRKLGSYLYILTFTNQGLVVLSDVNGYWTTCGASPKQLLREIHAAFALQNAPLTPA